MSSIIEDKYYDQDSYYYGISTLDLVSLIADDQWRVGPLLTGCLHGPIVSMPARVAPVRLNMESRMRTYPPFTHALCLQLIEYDPSAGTWMGKAKVGFDRETHTYVLKVFADFDRQTETLVPKPQPITGWIHENPYEKDGEIVIYRNRIIQLNGKPYRAARLAWFYMKEEWPPEDLEVDHINHDALDDRWENLRLGTRQQQSANSRRSTRSGYKGVHYHKQSGLHRAIITVNGKQRTRYFKTEEEAYAVYCEMAEEQWGEFACVDTMPTKTEMANPPMKYDIPIQSVVHAQFCKEEAQRRYAGGLIKDRFGMWLVEDENGLCHTDAVLRALSRYDREAEDAA